MSEKHTFESAVIAFAESIQALADSNNKVAESNAAIVEKYEQLIALQGGDAAPAKPAKGDGDGAKPRGRPKKDAPAKEEPKGGKSGDDDGFGDDGDGDDDAKPTFDEVKEKLKEAAKACGDKAPALKLIGKHGYNAISEIQEKDYAAIYKGAQKLIDDAD